MKFLVDENLPPRLAAWLQERGHEAAHVRDLNLKSDRDLMTASSTDAWIIVTKDSDFDSPRAGVRVLKLGIGNGSTDALLTWLDHALPPALARFNNGETFVELD